MAKQQSKKGAKINLTALESSASVARATVGAAITAPNALDDRYTIQISGHLSDAVLQSHYDYRQIGLPWDEIKKSVATIVPDDTQQVGIQLEQAQHQLVLTLQRLLDASRRENVGNAEQTIKISFGQLVREYYDTKELSGKHLKELHETMRHLEDRKFLFIIRQKQADGSIKESWKREQLIKFGWVHSVTEADTESKPQPKPTTELTILLHPIFTLQIDEKFVLIYDDLLSQIKAASGSDRIAEATYLCVLYLHRQLGFKAADHRIGEERLIYQLRLNAMRKAGRKGRVLERINDALDVAEKMGLLISWERIPKGKTAQYRLLLNLDYIRPKKQLPSTAPSAEEAQLQRSLDAEANY